MSKTTSYIPPHLRTTPQKAQRIERNWRPTPAPLKSQQPNIEPKTYKPRYFGTGMSSEKVQRIDQEGNWRSTPARGTVQHIKKVDWTLVRYGTPMANFIDNDHDSKTTTGDEVAMVFFDGSSDDGIVVRETGLSTMSEDETLGGEDVEGRLMIEGKERLMIGWKESVDEGYGSE